MMWMDFTSFAQLTDKITLQNPTLDVPAPEERHSQRNWIVLGLRNWTASAFGPLKNETHATVGAFAEAHRYGVPFRLIP